MLDTEKTNASEMAELTAKFDKILACLSDEDYEAYPKKEHRLVSMEKISHFC